MNLSFLDVAKIPVSIANGDPEKNIFRVRWFCAGIMDGVPLRTSVMNGNLSHELNGPVHSKQCQRHQQQINGSRAMAVKKAHGLRLHYMLSERGRVSN
jgi:hypothetical protein|eukprot:COSAG01_NODE_414_length_17360_cov_226.576907_14_plen_98_part_00